MNSKTKCKVQRVIAHYMVLSFISLVVCGNKLFLSLLVRAESILYPVTLFDFIGENSPFWGRVGPSVILRDLLRQRWV